MSPNNFLSVAFSPYIGRNNIHFFIIKYLGKVNKVNIIFYVFFYFNI